jgi:hypothetical protein
MSPGRVAPSDVASGVCPEDLSLESDPVSQSKKLIF